MPRKNLNRATVETSAVEPVRVTTDLQGRVQAIDGDVLHSLNISARGLLGRQLSHFFPKDRVGLFGCLRHAVQGQEVILEAVIQPLEQKPRPVRLTLRPAGGPTDNVEWVIAFQ